jgi:hypothetical protein
LLILKIIQSGWGRIYDKGPESSILKNAKVTVYGKSYCKLVGPKTPKDWNSQICAGSLDGSVDSCQGGEFIFKIFKF